MLITKYAELPDNIVAARRLTVSRHDLRQVLRSVLIRAALLLLHSTVVTHAPAAPDDTGLVTTGG